MKKFMPFKKSSVPPADDNPYSAPPPAYEENPYASQSPAQNDPYAAKSAPPSTRAPAGGLPGGPGANRFNSPAPSAGSGGGGYGADRYGASGGYGSNRYDNDPPRAGSRGPGGYGGLGRTNSASNDDDGRDNLFAGARERVQQQQQQPPVQDSRPPGPPRYDSGGDDGNGRGELFGGARERYEQAQRQPARGGGDDEDDAYGGYGAPREMTAEEEEEQEVADTKNRIKELKQESAASSARSLAAGQAALEASRSTMARLGAQGERLHNTEKNLDLAASHNKVAQQQTSKLKSLNRSMFAVHVNNPFTAASKEERRREELLAEHQAQRTQREETRRLGNQTNSRVEQALKDMSISNDEKPQFQRNLAARAKYQFEDDDEDDEAEDQIEENVTQLESVTKGLHQASLAIGRELDQQNKLIDRIGKKSDLVDDQVRLNRDRLARIR
jgi:hypothetical protein